MMTKGIGIAAKLAFRLVLMMLVTSSWLVVAREERGEGASVAGSELEVGVTAALAQMPLYFIENQGQVHERVGYYVQGKDKTLYFTSEGVTFVLTDLDETLQEDLRPPRLGDDGLRRWVVKLDFVGANPDARPVGLDETGAVISYFRGRPEEWRTGLKTYSKVVYRNLWPGVDLEYSGTVNELKYQFVVQPGADAAQIRLAYGGADVSVNEAGELEVSTPAGGFHDGAPLAYQEIEGERTRVEVSYELQQPTTASHAYGFRVAGYDKSKPLVLDPAVLVYCGYIGGSGDEDGRAIAIDAAGNAYVTGRTHSSETTFPISVGPYLSHSGSLDVFVAKVLSGGMGLDYCGYIGGTGDDEGRDIAIDSAGGAYVTGWTYSDEATFPVTTGPCLIHGGNGKNDAFVAKVEADGTRLAYCGYIGGSDYDGASGIAADDAGNAYVSGSTMSSQDEGFPVFVGPDLTHNGADDAFVAKVKADGTTLVYSGYIGGSSTDAGHAIAVDGDGNAYVTGQTFSGDATFPVLIGPGLTHGGGVDAFVTKVKSDGTGFDYSGYIGGSGEDQGWGIAVDGAGNAWLTGWTDSSEATFPVTVGPDLSFNGNHDAFVAKVRTDGTALLYCGYLGGSDHERGLGIALDSAGHAYVTGWTASSEATFPVTVGPDLTFNGARDGFVVEVWPDGTGLVYCGYVGGSDFDSGMDIAVDGNSNAYITGQTYSGEAEGFPVAVGPDLTYNGGADAFVAKVFSNELPTLGTVVPSSGGGSPGVATAFITSWGDADGWEDLKQCYFHIGASPAAEGNVTLMYNAQKSRLWIRRDDGTTWLGGYAPGSANILENGQAQVDCSLTIVQGSGDSLVVAWAISFKPTFAGSKKTYLKCTDVHGASAKGEWKGSWTIE